MVYLDWRIANFIRDKHTCQKCKKNRKELKKIKLHVHHIEDFANNPDIRVSINNGITLCENCHKDFHHQYGIRSNRECVMKFLNNENYFNEECIYETKKIII